MITILAEKPDVGKKIAAALDKITLKDGRTVAFSELKANEREIKAQQSADGYLRICFKGQDCCVTWGFGHLCELKQAKDYNAAYADWSKLPLPFTRGSYEVQLRQIPSAKDKSGYNDKVKKQFSVIKELFNKSECIINATDYDREGEVIFSYIYELAKCTKPVWRVCFASQTREGVCGAFEHLLKGADRKRVEEAGRMRGLADWLVGSNLTAAMTLRQDSPTVLSIGRVQTPTLNMLVERELAIRGFVREKYLVPEAVFTTDGGESYKGEYACRKRFTALCDVNAILSKMNGKKGVVKDVSKKRQLREVPQLYSLSALQMDANSKYGMTLKETLNAAQALYDGGYTTYPRTDSRFLTQDMEPVVNNVLDALCTLSEYALLIKGRTRRFEREKYFDDKMVESHFAIIPTGSIPTSLPKQQKDVYDLIARSLIRMLYRAAVIQSVKVSTEVEGELFCSTGSAIEDAGWMVVGGGAKESPLPELAMGETVTGKYAVAEKETEPPKRYTDKALLAAMMSAGKDLQDEELKKILADPSVSGIGTPATRDAIIETLITRGYIARDKKALRATDAGVSLIQSLPSDTIKSPEMTAKWEARLHDIEQGKDSSVQFLHDIETSLGVWCREIGGAAAEGAKESGAGLVCPTCGKSVVAMKWGWGCSGYREGCKFAVNRQIAGKHLTEAQVRRLIQKGDTGMLNGFRSKAGKPFSARLVLDEKQKVVFRFS